MLFALALSFFSFSAASSSCAFFFFSSSIFSARRSSAFSLAFFFCPICFWIALMLEPICVAAYCVRR